MTPLQRKILKLASKPLTVRQIAARAKCGLTMVRKTVKELGNVTRTVHAAAKSAPTLMRSLANKETSLYSNGNLGDQFEKRVSETLKAKIAYHENSARKLKEALEVLESSGIV